MFNFEGGCYAKVIDAEAEPQMYHAIRFGSILENVIIDPQTRVIDYSSDFLSGFTSKVAGTEVGIGEPRPTFSPCYGAPFMPLHPDRYATMLAERLAWHEADCWLVNTGWTGGPYGTGHRMSIELTRGLLTAALDGALAKAGFTPHPVFKVLVPDGCCCAAEGELDLRATWADKDAYDATPRAGRHVRRQLRAVPRHGHRGGTGGGAGRDRVDAAAGRRLCRRRGFSGTVPLPLYTTMGNPSHMPQLRIVVLVKQVPDTANVTGDAMKEDGTVNRAALPAVFNPEDLNALEEALRLKDRCDARVSVVTMGPPAAAQVLRESLYRGADEVILLTDKAFAGADTLATSYALSLAVRKLGGADLVLCGRQAIDGDTAQVGPQTAEKLRYPQITCVSRIDELIPPDGVGAGSVTATRSIEGGFETLTSTLPCLLTVSGEANEPRPASVKLVMTYKNAVAEASPGYDDSYLDPESDAAEVCLLSRTGKPVCRARIVQWDHVALEADRDALGLRGSPTRVKEIESVVLEQSEARMVEPDEAGVNALVHELIEEHILG